MAEPALTLLTGPDAGRSVGVGALALLIGRADDVDLHVDDGAVSRHHARITREECGGHFLEDLGSTNGTLLRGERIARALLSPGDLVQLGPRTQMRFAVTDAADSVLQRKVYELSVRDGLTQTYNRNHFAERLGGEVVLARDTGRDATLLMIDVDGLKQINDEHGHPAGDRALAFVAAHVTQLIRSDDFLARYGGDEFVLIAPRARRSDALQLAERICTAVSALRLGVGAPTLGVTVSIGVASLSEIEATDAPLAALIALADRRLYAAKHAGRNRVHAGEVA